MTEDLVIRIDTGGNVLMSPHSMASDDDSGAFSRLPPSSRHAQKFTMSEAAKAKGVSYHTVSRAVRSDKLPAQRYGRRVLINGRDLAAWEPMRERAPLRYRNRRPAPETMPGVVDLANGEYYELARRLSAVYEAIQASALNDPLDVFKAVTAERFANAMEFDRVAIWSVSADRQEISLTATYGDWFSTGAEPASPPTLPYDPEHMYASQSNIYDGIDCWMCEPRPVRLGVAFSASMVANGLHIGYIIGDRNGEHFTLTPSQIELGDSLSAHFATVIALRQSHDLEVIRREQALAAANDYAAALNAFAHAFNQGESLIALIRRACRDATRLTGAHYGGVMLQRTSETLDSIWHLDGEDLPVKYLEMKVTELKSSLRAFRSGRPRIVPWHESTAVERSFWEPTGTRSNVHFPLNVNGEFVGVMMMRFREEAPQLTAAQISFCETLANACVAAITRDRLLEAVANR